MADRATREQLVEKLWQLHRRGLSYACASPAANLLLADMAEGLRLAAQSLDAALPQDKRIAVLEEENTRLRALVERAYVEGHNHGRANPPVYQHSSEDWAQSRSRAALNGGSNDQG